MFLCCPVLLMPTVRFEHYFAVIVTLLEKNCTLRGAGEQPRKARTAQCHSVLCAERNAGGCRKENKELSQAGIFSTFLHLMFTSSTFNVYIRQMLLSTFLLIWQKEGKSWLKWNLRVDWGTETFSIFLYLPFMLCDALWTPSGIGFKQKQA